MTKQTPEEIRAEFEAQLKRGANWRDEAKTGRQFLSFAWGQLDAATKHLDMDIKRPDLAKEFRALLPTIELVADKIAQLLDENENVRD